MTNDERPTIEPLSDAAWSRVERGLWSRVDAELAPAPVPAVARRRWWLAVAPLAVAAAIAILVGVTRGPDRVAVGEPSRVVSGASPSAISFGDVHVELDPDTALAMSHETGQPIASLERGAAWVTVAPRGERPPVLVRAGDATVRVIGTQFRVARADERVVVAVAHGVVEIAYRGENHAVSGGQRWSSETPAQVVSDVPAVPSPQTPSPPAQTPSPQTPSPQTPPPQSPPAQTPPPQPASVQTPPARTHSAPPANIHSSPSTAEPAVDRDQAEYDRLTALEAQSSERAIAGYLALSHSTSPWAGPALFAAARLAVDRGDHRAAALLDSYLKRFPTGANAADAQALRRQLAN